MPPGIPQQLADSIDFIGKAVRLLRAPVGTARGQALLPYQDTLEFAAALMKLQREPRFNQVALERTVEAIRADVSHLHSFSLVLVLVWPHTRTGHVSAF